MKIGNFLFSKVDFLVANLLTFMNLILLIFWSFSASSIVSFSKSPSRFFRSIVCDFAYLGVNEWNDVFFVFSMPSMVT